MTVRITLHIWRAFFTIFRAYFHSYIVYPEEKSRSWIGHLCFIYWYFDSYRYRLTLYFDCFFDDICVFSHKYCCLNNSLSLDTLRYAFRKEGFFPRWALQTNCGLNSSVLYIVSFYFWFLSVHNCFKWLVSFHTSLHGELAWPIEFDKLISIF